VGRARSANGGKKNVYKLLVGRISYRCDRVVWTGFVWLSIGKLEISCEFSSECSHSIKCLDTIEWLHN
jgi:hypothetical protein